MSTTVLQSAAPSTTSSGSTKAQLVGRIVSALAIAFMTFDAAVKLVGAKVAIESTAQLGFPTSIVFPLGLIQLGCLILYVVPRTAPLGAALLTAYLGGAVATHVRLGNPMFTHVLSPVYVAIFFWGGLYLRDPRVRALLDRMR